MGHYPWESPEDYPIQNAEGSELWFRKKNRNLCYHCLAYPVFSDTMFNSTLSRRATNEHKYMSQTLDRLKLSRWHPDVNHTRPCHCCLWNMGSCQPVFATMSKNVYKVNFIRSSKMLHVTWNIWSHILPDQMLQKERLKSLRKRLVVSCCSPEPKALMVWLFRVGSLH